MTSSSPVAGGIAFNAALISDLPVLMSVVERACCQAGANDEVLFSLRLAVEEVFTDILDYGYPGGTGPITIYIDAYPDEFRVSFADEAPCFDPASIPAPKLDVPPEQREVGGLGWHLVRQVMDRVEWEPREQGGNLFTLIKSLPAASSARQGANVDEHRNPAT